MSKKYDKKEPDSNDEIDALAQRLLRQGKVRAALNRAKTVHKVKPSPGAEALLLRCYAARVRELRSAGQKAEAEQIEQMVAANFPGRTFPPVDSPPAASAGSSGDSQKNENSDSPLGVALARLADAGATESDRRAAELDVARLAFDPAALAEHPALTIGHPLAAAAKAVAAAFANVVSRPVDEAEIALPEVSRRSPLAGWKLLVRAIAHLQRREDRLAVQALDRLSEMECAAARLVPPLRAIVAGKWDELDGVGKRIFSAWRPREKRLDEALRRLDAVFSAMLPEDDFSFAPVKLVRKREKDLHAALRDAAGAVRLEAPALTPVFREAAATKMLTLPDISLAEVEKSLGGPVARTASFWRLAALAVEERIRLCGDVGDLFDLRDCWIAFLRHGVAEGLFPVGGAEESELWVHLANAIMEQGVFGAADNPKAKRSVDLNYCYDPGQDAGVLALAPAPDDKPDPTDPMAFFARAAGANPTSELFRSWLEAARQLDAAGGWRVRGSGKNNDFSPMVLTEWARLLPGDPTPSLILMDEAERRDALTLAQKHLAAAEAVDPLNADLTRAKWRLALAMCRRHLKQGKAHLVEADLKKLDVLRRFGPADAGWLLTGLRWLLAATITEKANAAHAELAEAAGGGEAGECAAGLIETAIAVHSSKAFFLTPPPPLLSPSKKSGDVVLAASRAFKLLAATGFSIAWGKKSPWPAWIVSVSYLWPRADLPAVIRPLFPEKFFAEAFALTACGLTDAGRAAETGRLLLLRAFILREGRTYQHDRMLRCVRAAFEIGRRLGDRELMAEALAWARDTSASRRFFVEADNAIGSMADDELDEVLNIERENPSLPKAGSKDPHEEAVDRRREDDDDDFDYFDEDDSDFDGEFDVGAAALEVFKNQTPQYIEQLAKLLGMFGFSPDGATRLAEVAAPEVMRALVEGIPVGDDIFDFYQLNPELREKSLEVAAGLSEADRRLFEEHDRRAAASRASRPKKNKRGRRKKR